MFSKEYNADNRKFRLYVTITCKGKKRFRTFAEDSGKKNSKYVERDVEVDGKRTIYFSFPITPKVLHIVVVNSEIPQDTDFEVQLIEAPLPVYNIWVDADTDEFVKLALQFSQVCGFQPASSDGRLFKTNSGKFNIKYFDIIRDNGGGYLNTPARIGHRTGVIEVAKVKFDSYTIPMRMVILLHEFSHKYKNPKIGLQISDEVGADINALYIYLGMGFSKIDAICVFANVFLKAQTKSNMERMRKIMDYIQRFESQEFAERY